MSSIRIAVSSCYLAAVMTGNFSQPRTVDVRAWTALL
jgi:hypothetical protein